jgi:capsular exopolysaccharide synthesis family protein
VSPSIQDDSTVLVPSDVRGDGTPEHTGISSGEISLPEILQVFRRRRRILIASVIFVLFLGMLYCLLKTRKYEAVADLAINPEGSNSLDMGDIASSIGGGGLGFTEKLETQVRILQSKSLAWTVISELRLDKRSAFAGRRKFMFTGPLVLPPAPELSEQTDPARRNQLLDAFSRSLSVRVVPRTQAIEIAFRSVDPALARDIVNRLASAYEQRTFMTRYNDTMKASDWLSGQMTQLKSSVESSQTRLSGFQRQTGIFGTDENNNLVLSKLDDLSKQLTDAQADRILREAQYHVAESAEPELLATIVPDSVLPLLRAQEVTLKGQIEAARQQYGPKYPKVIQLNNQLDQLNSSIQKEVAAIQQRFRVAYEASSGTEKRMRSAFDQQKQLANDMSQGLDTYGVLKREVESSNDLYDDLQKKLKEAGVIASLKAVTVDPIDLALLPTRPVEPRKSLALALSIIFGLALGTTLAFLMESLDTVVHSPDEIEALTAVSLFGVIPHIRLDRGKFKPQIGEKQESEFGGALFITLRKPQSHAAEAYRALRTAILLASAGSPPKTIVITSAAPGEGKTTTSVNIAIALSQLGHRVLLIDADLRRGTIREQLKLPTNFGLSGSITGTGRWRDAVVELSAAPDLHVLQGGLRPPNSAELLGSAQMRRILGECKAEYDHVIIDSAPSLLVTDAVLLAQWVDMVILVSRVGVTSRVALRRTRALLRTGSGNLSGIVANDISSGEGYGYGYGYGYKSRDGYYTDQRE